MIKDIQENIKLSHTMNSIIRIPHDFLFETEACVYALFALFLVADSWLAYKTTLVTGLGLYALIFMQLTFKSGRPFWDVADIESNGNCFYDFSGPSESSFIMTFFWPYVLLQFLCKYNATPRTFLNWGLFAILVALWADMYFFSLVNGVNYAYQMVLGQLLGFCYLVSCMVFDQELQSYTLKVGFSMRGSRDRKFYLFFFLLGLFTTILVYYVSLTGVWLMP